MPTAPQAKLTTSDHSFLLRPRRHDVVDAGVGDRLAQMLAESAAHVDRQSSHSHRMSEKVDVFLQIAIGHLADRNTVSAATGMPNSGFM